MSRQKTEGRGILCLLFWKMYTILNKHICRCEKKVDVADSKSAASDGVPVRVRSPAPIKDGYFDRVTVLLFLHENTPKSVFSKLN